MVDYWRWVSIFSLLLSGCSADKKETNTTAIAVEERVMDLIIRSDQPDVVDYNSADATLGWPAEGGETRVLIAIPHILNLYRTDVVLSSIANIQIEIHAAAVKANPENIRLSFVGKSFTPLSSWNSRFTLNPGYEWEQPGGDVLDLPYATPGISKVSETSRDKILSFNITDQMIDAVGSDLRIEGFLIQVIAGDYNAENTLPMYTSNSSDAYAPRATLTYSSREVVIQ